MARDRRPVPAQPVPATAGPANPFRAAALGTDQQLAALTAVASALTRQIAVQTGALGANTAALVSSARAGGPGPGGPPTQLGGPGRDLTDRVGSLFSGGVAAIAARVAAPLAPLAVFAQTLNATTSGFGTFLKMTQLVTTSLAGLFLPAMLVAAGVTFAVAKVMDGPLLTAMTEFAKKALPDVMAAADGLAGSFRDIAAAAGATGVTLKDLADVVGGITPGLRALGGLLDTLTGASKAGAQNAGFFESVAGGVLGHAGQVFPWLSGAGAAGAGALAGTAPVAPTVPTAPAGTPAAPGAPPRKSDALGDFVADMRRGMELALRSMRQDIGPPASFNQDLTAAFRDATLAALNVNPIDKEMRDIMLRQLDAMERLISEVNARDAVYN